VATSALVLSCLCCLLSPLVFLCDNPVIFVSFLLFWGIVVIADSPLFSTLAAQSIPSKIKGTALTIMNCIGFSITIISIQFINRVSTIYDFKYSFMFLAIGPVLGLISLFKTVKK